MERSIRHPGHVTRLCVWAELELGIPVTDATLHAVDQAWPGSDESFCSSPARHEPDVLALSFDVTVENDDYDSAFAQARQDVLRLAADVGLPNQLRPLVGYTDTHQWTEGE